MTTVEVRGYEDSGHSKPHSHVSYGFQTGSASYELAVGLLDEGQGLLLEKKMQRMVEASAMEADRSGGSPDNGGDELEDNSRKTRTRIPDFEEIISEIDNSIQNPSLFSNLNKAE